MIPDLDLHSSAGPSPVPLTLAPLARRPPTTRSPATMATGPSRALALLLPSLLLPSSLLFLLKGADVRGSFSPTRFPFDHAFISWTSRVNLGTLLCSCSPLSQDYAVYLQIPSANLVHTFGRYTCRYHRTLLRPSIDINALRYLLLPAVLYLSCNRRLGRV
jgi:hypothetical protein